MCGCLNPDVALEDMWGEIYRGDEDGERLFCLGGISEAGVVSAALASPPAYPKPCHQQGGAAPTPSLVVAPSPVAHYVLIVVDYIYITCR